MLKLGLLDQEAKQHIPGLSRNTLHFIFTLSFFFFFSPQFHARYELTTVPLLPAPLPTQRKALGGSKMLLPL